MSNSEAYREKNAVALNSVLAAVFLTVTNLFARTWRLPDRRARWGTTVILGLFFALTVSLGWYFGWAALEPRMEQIGEGFQNREEMYDAARPMAGDYPLFGTGPGTFATVFQLYRFSNDTYWPEQLHNDWLETLITFGWVGMLLIAAAFLLLLGRWYAPGPLGGGRRLPALLCVSLATCLLHARWDFPFQILSIIHLFMILCGVFFVLSSQRIR